MAVRGGKGLGDEGEAAGRSWWPPALGPPAPGHEASAPGLRGTWMTILALRLILSAKQGFRSICRVLITAGRTERAQKAGPQLVPRFHEPGLPMATRGSQGASLASGTPGLRKNWHGSASSEKGMGPSGAGHRAWGFWNTDLRLRTKTRRHSRSLRTRATPGNGAAGQKLQGTPLPGRSACPR